MVSLLIGLRPFPNYFMPGACMHGCIHGRVAQPTSSSNTFLRCPMFIPGMTQSRLLPTVLLAASSWLLISLFGSQQSLSIELVKHASSNSGVETIANSEAFCLPLPARVKDLLPDWHFSSGILSSEPNCHARLQG